MSAAGGASRDITSGDFDSPPIDLGGSWSYDWSPDGREIAFTRNVDPDIAISTNNDIFTVPFAGGEARKITDNQGNDSQPLYSPDGKYIAYLQMKRPGFEADQKQLVLFERASGKRRIINDQLSYSVNDYLWGPDSKMIYFNADDKSNESLFRLDVTTGKIEVLVDKGYNHSLRMFPDGKGLILVKESVNQPAEIYRIDQNGKNAKRLTSTNDEKLRGIEMTPKEDFWFEGAAGAKVHGFIVKPAGFDPTKKYPMILLVHGGPQGQWGDQIGRAS
jgi:dipeptidyl aminopeptidase/acylaminoacyl peptidase